MSIEIPLVKHNSIKCSQVGEIFPEAEKNLNSVQNHCYQNEEVFIQSMSEDLQKKD